MSYQVLARKWRPQDFSSLVGQEAIVTALTNALSERRIAQAYLFSGIRGVGKTTAARLLAKSLNCVEGPTATPCNQCTPCREITAGSDLDVIEVDAATYSKVEQVRELTESLRYGPARDRYKVVVLDEIHRLSRQAFDALLKIVEEPPPHLVFVFATTEAEAVPATVLSRCQEFHFRRVSSDVLSGHLRNISEAEEIEVSDPALHLIARAGEGSVRDSVALLDQLATFGAGTIADEDAARLVGGLDGGLLQGLLESILAGGSPAVSAAVSRLEDEGRDPRQAYNQLLTFTRDALRLALASGRGGDEPRVDLPLEDARALAAMARDAGYENLLRLLQQLLASESLVRRSENGYLALEVAWLRAAELPKLTRVEAMLGGGPVTVPRPEGGGGGSGGSAAGGDGGTDGGSPASGGGRSAASASRSATPSAAATATRDAAPEPLKAQEPSGRAAAKAGDSTASTTAAPSERATTQEAQVADAQDAETQDAVQNAGVHRTKFREADAPEAGAPEVEAKGAGAPGAGAPEEESSEALGAAPPDSAEAEPANSEPVVIDSRTAEDSPAAESESEAKPEADAEPEPKTPRAAEAETPDSQATPQEDSEEPPWARSDPSDPEYGSPAEAAPAARTSTPSGRGADRRPTGTSGGMGGGVAGFLDQVRRHKEALAAHLNAAELRFEEGVLRIRHEPGDGYLPQRLSRAGNRELVEQAVENTWGPGIRWRLEEGEARSTEEEAEATPDPRAAELAAHPKVQTVLELFDGTIDSVEERN